MADITYDGGVVPNSTTNRISNALGVESLRRVNATLPIDLEITVSSTACTVQARDPKGRPFKGYVSFDLHQTVSGLGSAQETTNGRLPSSATTGTVIKEITTGYWTRCMTDANGAFACTLSAGLTSPDKLVGIILGATFSHT